MVHRYVYLLYCVIFSTLIPPIETTLYLTDYKLNLLYEIINETTRISETVINQFDIGLILRMNEKKARSVPTQTKVSVIFWLYKLNK